MSEGIVLMADPLVAAIAVHEDGEALCDASAAPGLVADRRCGAAGRLLRVSVAARLAQAATGLPSGLRLLLVEGYRSMDDQTRDYTTYRDRLARAHPELGADELRTAASRYISPPELAPHCAGAAADVTLIDAAGRELDLGTPVDGYTDALHDGGCYTAAPLPPPARANRDILITALTGAGLINYPTEWWHWSYGDRYWALITAASSARYGPTRPPS